MGTSEQLTTVKASRTLAGYSVPTFAKLVEIRLDDKKYPRIGADTFDNAVKKMSNIVLAALVYRGQEANPQHVLETATALVAEIFAERGKGLSLLSWEEIGMAVRRSVLEPRPDAYFKVCVASLYQAILDYVKTEGTRAATQAKALRDSQPKQMKLTDQMAQDFLTGHVL